MRKAIFLAFLLILTSCGKNMENEENTSDVKNNIETIEKSKQLEFVKSVDFLDAEEVDDFEKYFKVVDKEGNEVKVKKRLLDKNLLEVYATDSDNKELRKTVRIQKESQDNNDKLIEKPSPQPDKKYR